MLLLRDLPKFEAMQACAARYPELDPRAAEAYLMLLRVATDIFQLREHFLSLHGVTNARFTVLLLLHGQDTCEEKSGEPLTPSDLASRAGVSRASMTGVLDGMVRDGMVRREPHGQDRRMQVVRLTEQGAAKVETMLPLYFSLVRDLMLGLDNTDLANLMGVLGRLREGVPEAAPLEVEQAEIQKNEQTTGGS